MRREGADLISLHAAATMSFSGGSQPYTYGEYRRREKLRRQGLLKFWGRRNQRWDWNCYDITPRGYAALELEGLS